MRVARQSFEERADLLRQPARGREPAVVLRARRRVGQVAVPEEVRDVFERGRAREVRDLVPAVEQPPFHPVDLADRGPGGDDVFESRFPLLGDGHACLLDRPGALA